MPRLDRTMHCSFCGKSQHDVDKLIAGPKVHICDACVGACITILGEDRDWCDREIANIERLRQQAPNAPTRYQPQPPTGGSCRNWLGRLFSN